MLAGLLADSGSAAAILIAFVLLFVVVVVMAIIARLIVVGNPSEMLIISGRRQRDGVGYRIVIGGRTLVIPLIEHVARLSLRNMQVPLEVKAQAGGGTMVPVIVTGVANVKVSSDPSERANAIERFLGQPAEQLQRVSKETLEGGLRAVIGKMTPEEIVGDREKFVATVMREVTEDFRKLGLLIDSVVIQNVHDEEEYLVSIARKARAEVLSSARKAEAERAAEAVMKEAEANASARKAKADRDAEAKLTEAGARQRAEQARLTADKAVAVAENELRIRKAELARDAAAKEVEQQKAEVLVEQARLSATEVARAIAARDVAKAKAEGDAAKTFEEGKARVGPAVPRSAQGHAAGDDAGIRAGIGQDHRERGSGPCHGDRRRRRPRHCRRGTRARKDAVRIVGDDRVRARRRPTSAFAEHRHEDNGRACGCRRRGGHQDRSRGTLIVRRRPSCPTRFGTRRDRPSQRPGRTRSRALRTRRRTGRDRGL
jgi:flotillin